MSGRIKSLEDWVFEVWRFLIRPYLANGCGGLPLSGRGGGG